MTTSWDSFIRKEMRRHARTPIAAFGDGQYGKIVGTVRCEEPIVAPVSRRECAWFEVSHMHLEGSVWHVHQREASGTPFFVADDTGEALIEGDLGEVVLLPDHDLRREYHYDRDYHRWMPGPDPNPFAPRTVPIRHFEGVIEHGEKVSVVGWGRWEPDPDPRRAPLGYRERPVRLVLRTAGRHQVLITDKPSIVDR